MIRSLWFWANLLVVTFVNASSVVVAALLGIRGGVYDWAPRSWARHALRAGGVRVNVEGMQHVHRDRPQVFASNHQSWFDVFALAAVIPGKYRFVAKKELEKIPIFGRAWKAAGHISIDRGDRGSAIRSLEQAGALIREDNSSVVIFPEGTRSWDGTMLPFKKGAFMLALHTGVEIVPAAVVGSRDVLRKGDWRVYARSITVRFGEPVDTSRFSIETRDELIALVRARVAELLAQPAGGATGARLSA